MSYPFTMETIQYMQHFILDTFFCSSAWSEITFIFLNFLCLSVNTFMLFCVIYM